MVRLPYDGGDGKKIEKIVKVDEERISYTRMEGWMRRH